MNISQYTAHQRYDSYSYSTVGVIWVHVIVMVSRAVMPSLIDFFSGLLTFGIILAGASSHTCVEVIFIAPLYGDVVYILTPDECRNTVCYTFFIDQCKYLFRHGSVEVFSRGIRCTCRSCLCRRRCCGILLRGSCVISSSIAVTSCCVICCNGIHSRLFGYDVLVTYITSGVI